MSTLADSLAVASDPSSSVEVLIAFANDPRPEIQQALGRNPNTPLDLLHQVWQQHPACILENPILTLWEFNRTGTLASQIGHGVLLKLYNHLRRQCEPLPPEIFTHSAFRDMIRKSMSSQDGDVFVFLPTERERALRRLLVEDSKYRGLFRFYETHAPDEVWKSLASDPDPDIRLDFANLLRSAPFDARPERAIAGEAARILMQDGRHEILQHLANCRFLPAVSVEELSRSADVEIREALSRCYLAPESALERLARDPEESVRVSLARNCEMEAIQRLLLRDSSVTVRKQLAESQHLPASLIGEFDLNDDPKVVRSVFLRADDKFRARILQMSQPEVQQALLDMEESLRPGFYRANKSAILPDILAKLSRANRVHSEIIDDMAQDERPEIRLGVALRLGSHKHWRGTPRNIALVNKFAKDSSPQIRHEICTDWRLDAESTASLFADRDPVLRKRTLCAVLDFLVAEREGRRFENYVKLYCEKAPLIVKLARDPDHAVRFAIASCKEAPPAAMKILFDDPESFIREAVFAHERWPYGVLIDLEKRLGSEGNGKVLRNGQTTPGVDALPILAKSRNPFERKLVAHCQRTSIRDLRILAEDPQPAVRQTARAKLAKRRKPKSA
ncbi:MAG: hypothetical protein ACKOLA_12595 [Spartobacteria bacterium]